MTRLSFAIFGQSSDDLLTGLSIDIYDASNNLVAKSVPDNNELLVNDNNDGTYYVDGLPTGEYSVNTDNIPQDELKNIPFISSDGLTTIANGLTTSDIATTATNSNAKVWGGALLTTQLALKENADATIIKEGELATSSSTNSTTTAVASSVTKALKDLVDGKETADATILKQANIVDNLTSTSTTAPLSAKQGKTLKDAQDALSTPTYNGGAVGNFSTSDFDLSSSTLKVKSDYSSNNYISTSNSIVQNLSALDSAVYFGSGSGSGGGSNARVVVLDVEGENYMDGAIPNTARSNTGFVYKLANSIAGLSGTSFSHTDKTYYNVKRIDFYKQPWMNQIVWFANGVTSASGIALQAKMTCDTLQIESSEWGNSRTTKGIYLNIDSLAQGNFYSIMLQLQLKYSGTANGTIYESMVVVKENITAQSGDTTLSIDNPVVM